MTCSHDENNNDNDNDDDVLVLVPVLVPVPVLGAFTHAFDMSDSDLCFDHVSDSDSLPFNCLCKRRTKLVAWTDMRICFQVSTAISTSVGIIR